MDHNPEIDTRSSSNFSRLAPRSSKGLAGHLTSCSSVGRHKTSNEEWKEDEEEEEEKDNGFEIELPLRSRHVGRRREKRERKITE